MPFFSKRMWYCLVFVIALVIATGFSVNLLVHGWNNPIIHLAIYAYFAWGAYGAGKAGKDAIY